MQDMAMYNATVKYRNTLTLKVYSQTSILRTGEDVEVAFPTTLRGLNDTLELIGVQIKTQECGVGSMLERIIRADEQAYYAKRSREVQAEREAEQTLAIAQS
jgi:hypothetical protein